MNIREENYKKHIIEESNNNEDIYTNEISQLTRMKQQTKY